MKPLVLTFASTAAIEGNRLNGIAHVFGQRADMGSHFEEMGVDAFAEALKTSDPRAFMEHDRSKLLGRASAGTLRVGTETVDGKQVLAYSIDLPNTTYANDLRELVTRGDLSESSFGFLPGEFAWSKTPDGLRVRTHTKVKELIDVSPVAMPAFEGTSLQLHSRAFDGESIGSQLVRARARVMGVTR